MTAFDDFWAAYPRKTAKGDARKAWEKAARSEPNLLALCLDALAWQTKQEQWTRDGGKFVPYPATWLNREQWSDEDPAVAEAQARLARAAQRAAEDAAWKADRARVEAEQEARLRLNERAVAAWPRKVG
jgi:hypothetical protein